MAQNEAGKVSNITMGQPLGGSPDHGPGKQGGTIKGLVGEQEGGAEVFRDIPPMVRDIP